PFVDPARDPVADVDAVGMERDAARALQDFEPANRGRQFHPVVGGERFASGNLAFLLARAEKHRPAAGPRIPAASAVGEHLDEGKVGGRAQATSSRGSLKIMRSGEWFASSSLTSKRSLSAFTTSRTRTSGAEAP